MEVHYQCGVEDYLEAQYAHHRRSTLFYIISGLIIASSAIAGIYLSVTEGYSQGSPLLALVVFWALLRFILRPFYFRRDFRRHPNFGRAQTLHIDESGIEYKSDLGHSETKWEAYSKLRETPNLFMLYLGARLFQVIPKRAFPDQRREELRRLLQEKIPGRSPN